MRLLRLPSIHHDSSCVVISGDDESVVIDPGTSWYQLNVRERLEAALEGMPAVSAVLLTHRHFDTAGAAKHLAENWNVPVRIHPAGAGALEGGDLLTTWASRFNSDMPVTDVIPLEESERFDLGGVVITVLHLPGHTSDSVGYWIADRGVLIAGDLLPKPAHPARWDLPTGCLPDLYASVEKVLELNLESIVCGHGEWLQGEEQVRTELERHRDFLAGCMEDEGVRPADWPRPHPTCSWLTPKPEWPQ